MAMMQRQQLWQLYWGFTESVKMKWRKRITLERARYVPKTICLRASIQRKH